MTEPQATTGGGPTISFGPFHLVATRRLLLEGDKPVRLGSRAFDILTTLVERAGEVVSKEELIARAWPRTFVEEANLKIQVSALRRALGDGQDCHRYVVTVPGRGYNFVSPVSHQEPAQVPLSPTITAAGVHNLPLAVTRMIGRDEAVEDMFRQALDWAREHGSLSWELRAATSLARVLRDQDRPADAAACLQPIYDHFTEGFGTADLIAAKQLLDELDTPDRD